MSANPPIHVFRAYDIRGIVDTALTADLTYRVGRAIGSEARVCGERHIYVGRDGRLSSPALHKAVIDGLLESGCDVTDLGLVTTPMMYFAAIRFGTGSGVMVTGSHNPPDYNGIKIVLGGQTLASERIQALRQRIEQGAYATGAGRLDSFDIAPHYIERITGDAKLSRPFRVAVDCGNGAASVIAPDLLRALGCEVVELYCEVDGRFPNHHPDPSRPENLRDLIATVREQQADLGFAFDGDGDRLGVVTSNGEIIWPDRQMMLFAQDILARHPGGSIIFDVKSTRNLARVIGQHGGNPIMWKSGHSLLKARLRETGSLLAGEMTGHLCFADRWYGFDSAAYTAARLLEILSRDSRSPQEVFAELPDMIGTPELHLCMEEGEQFTFMERLMPVAHFEDATVTSIDGLRVDFDDGWGLVRASNTQPCLTLRFEGENEAALERIQQRFRMLLLELDPKLVLPF